jgi:hypothetical protein
MEEYVKGHISQGEGSMKSPEEIAKANALLMKKRIAAEEGDAGRGMDGVYDIDAYNASEAAKARRRLENHLKT